MNIATFPVTSLGSAAAAVIANAEVEKLAREPVEPGVYFGMPEADYHGDAALGSGDVKRLAYSPADYWFDSPLNPLREADGDPTTAQIFGRAVHSNVLEGRSVFDRQYAPCDYPGNIKAGKVERELIAVLGKTALKRADFDRIQQASAMIRANPYLSDAFSGGRAEVSVFWVKDGVRKKCRLDYVKVRATVDLKSIRNSRSIEFSEACRRAISEYRYDVQVEHYREGREAMRKLIAAGNVSGEVDPAWLQSVADADAFAWVFVFWQAEGAPLTWACSISPGNGIHDIARATITRAEANYRSHMEQFGPDTPWVVASPVNELFVEEMPAWFGRT
jgi:hypothetical protein